MLTEKEKLELKDVHTDKQLKKIFKKIASKNPDAYFPTKELKELGYIRKHCMICHTITKTASALLMGVIERL